MEEKETVDADAVIVAESTLKSLVVKEGHDSLLFWHQIFDGLNLSFKHQAFVIDYLGNGLDQNAAYVKVYGDVKYVSQSSARVMKMQSVKRAIIRAMHTNEISPEWLEMKCKEIVMNAKKDADKIKAIELIGKFRGAFLKDTQQAKLAKKAMVSWGS